MMKHFSLCLVACVVVITSVYGQSPNIENYLSMIESGQADPVRTELPSLLSKYPNNPGVLYLQAVLTTDGAEAVRMYQNIVDMYPASDWADASLYKVYKFYYAIGLFRTAEIKLNQLRTTYPNSKYLAGLPSVETPPAEKVVEAEQPPVTQAVETSPPKTIEIPKPPSSGEGAAGSAKVASAPPSEQKARIALQVGAFSTKANANKQKSFFAYHKYYAEVESKVSGSKELFIVYVGKYANEEEARVKGEEIKKAFNINYIVVTR